VAVRGSNRFFAALQSAAADMLRMLRYRGCKKSRSARPLSKDENSSTDKRSKSSARKRLPGCQSILWFCVRRWDELTALSRQAVTRFNSTHLVQQHSPERIFRMQNYRHITGR